MTHNFNPLLCLALAAILSAAPTVQAKAFASEDGGVMEAGDCELSFGLERSRSDEERGREVAAEFACGVGRASELAVEITRDGRGGDGRTGLTLGGKTRLWPRQAGDGPVWTLGIDAETQRAPGGRWQHSGHAVKLEHSRPFGDHTTLQLALEHERDVHARQDLTRWAAGIEWAGVRALGGLAPVVELFGDDRRSSWWRAGVHGEIVEDQWEMGLSWARQIRRGPLSDRPSSWLLSLTFAF